MEDMEHWFRFETHDSLSYLWQASNTSGCYCLPLNLEALDSTTMRNRG